jgi:hypothetical protein
MMRAMHVLYEGVGFPRRRSVAWNEKLILAWGKLRRFYLLHFRPDYVASSLRRRVGQCHRTGACCELMFSCPALAWVERLPVCRMYRRRPRNCTVFPIDERDLRDRDIVDPWRPCGFSFRAAEDVCGEARESEKVEVVLRG